MDGLKGALESHGLPQLFQGEVVLFGQQGAHLAAVGGDNHRLASAEPASRGNVAGAPTLLQELLDHAEGNPETVGNLRPGALPVIIGSQDSFAQIQR